MAQVLQTILSVTLAPLAQTTLAHGLNNGLIAVAPNKIIADRSTPIVVLSADDTNVTFQNPLETGDPVSTSFLVQFDHTIQQATPTGVPLQFFGQGGGGAAPPSERSNGWSPPDNPSAFDDEFDSGTSLSASWVLDDGVTPLAFAGSAFNSYAAYAAGNPRVNVNDRRASWMLLQPASNLQPYNLTKPVVLASDYLFMARIRVNDNDTVGSANISLIVAADNGGIVDINNFLQIVVRETTASFIRVLGGVTTTLTTTSAYSKQGIMMTYLAIQKVGATYYAWAAAEQGTWLWLGSTAFAPALSRAGYRMNGGAGTAPGPVVIGSDFIRYFPNVTNLVAF